MNIKQEIIEIVRSELINMGSEVRQLQTKRFFRERIECYGITNPETHALSKEIFQHIKHLSKEEVFEICTILWESGFLEESIIACNWSYKFHKQYLPTDFEQMAYWIRACVNNWASCDTLCNHTVGSFIEMYPEYINQLITFTQSENRWVKRAAAVSLIVPARKGLFLPAIFDIAVLMLTDGDDMVQKGYGWMLKEASKAHQEEVFEFVMQHKAVMPRTALRYAIEKMPPELRKMAMSK
jgi:3-methyladenine DNA glycosylase AlkD